MSEEIHDADSAGPQVAPFRPAAAPDHEVRAADDFIMMGVVQPVAIMQEIVGFVPNFGIHDPTGTPAIVFIDDNGNTYAGFRFRPKRTIDIHPDAPSKTRFALMGLAAELQISWEPISVDEASEPELDPASMLAFGEKGGHVQVSPELEESREEIQGAVETLTAVLNAARAKAQAKKED